MSEPEDQTAFERRFKAAYRLSGAGLDVAVHYPCPFCAAPEWLVQPVFATRLDHGPETTCVECGRSARFLTDAPGPGSVTVELVQTGGPPPPEWVPARWAPEESDTPPEGT